MAEMNIVVLSVSRHADGIVVANLIYYLDGRLIDQSPMEFIGSDTETTAMAKIKAYAQQLYDSIKRETTLDFNKHIGKTLTVTVV